MTDAPSQVSPPGPGFGHRPAVGDRLQLTIDTVAFGGDGVGRSEGFVLFVPFTAPGERVEVEVTEVKRQYGRARLGRVIEPSPCRVEPVCRYFGQCGGCQYQHLNYPTQLALKHAQVAELLTRIGRFVAASLDPVVPCPAPYGYRNRIMVRSQWDGSRQQLVVGFLRHDNRLVVDVESCAIAEPDLNRQLSGVRQAPPRKGGLKVMLRLAPDGWVLPTDSFFQNNFHLLPVLVDTVRSRLRDSGCRFLVDAYCGIGFFSLELAADVEGCVGIELDRPAVQAARENAGRRGCQNVEFHAGSVEAVLPTVMQRFPPAQTALLLDPPRRGCDRNTLGFLKEQQPAQILYISCHPATLARDLAILTHDGSYRLERVIPLDMFPQTQHIELVADLRATGSAKLQPCQEPRV
jgi:23S rRNA (uracil1939-C5)-methyltransferase